MDKRRPYIFGKLTPCYEENPTLWNLFCALTNREIGQPNYNWTEHDVITWMLARGLNDSRNSSTDNAQTGTNQSRPVSHIRRNGETSNVMVVRQVSSSEDDIYFVVGA